MPRRLLKLALPTLFILCSVPAAPTFAADDLPLLQMLTCIDQTDPRVRDTAMRLLERRGTDDGNGNLRIAGRVQSGNVCIEHAEVSGSFGVMMIFASLCDADPAPIIDFVKRLEPDLAAADVAPHEGLVAAFGTPVYGITFYRGEAGPHAAPDAHAKRISYTCTRTVSGPQ